MVYTLALAVAAGLAISNTLVATAFRQDPRPIRRAVHRTFHEAFALALFCLLYALLA